MYVFYYTHICVYMRNARTLRVHCNWGSWFIVIRFPREIAKLFFGVYRDPFPRHPIVCTHSSLKPIQCTSIGMQGQMLHLIPQKNYHFDFWDKIIFMVQSSPFMVNSMNFPGCITSSAGWNPIFAWLDPWTGWNPVAIGRFRHFCNGNSRSDLWSVKLPEGISPLNGAYHGDIMVLNDIHPIKKHNLGHSFIVSWYIWYPSWFGIPVLGWVFSPVNTNIFLARTSLHEAGAFDRWKKSPVDHPSNDMLAVSARLFTCEKSCFWWSQVTVLMCWPSGND